MFLRPDHCICFAYVYVSICPFAQFPLQTLVGNIK